MYALLGTSLHRWNRGKLWCSHHDRSQLLSCPLVWMIFRPVRPRHFNNYRRQRPAPLVVATQLLFKDTPRQHPCPFRIVWWLLLLYGWRATRVITGCCSHSYSDSSLVRLWLPFEMPSDSVTAFIIHQVLCRRWTTLCMYAEHLYIDIIYMLVIALNFLCQFTILINYNLFASFSKLPIYCYILQIILVGVYT